MRSYFSFRFLFAQLWLLTFLLGGCAVHPSPEDVTGITTRQIAEHIRCEARKAVEDKAIAMLRLAATNPADGLDPIPHAAQLADDLENHRDKFLYAKKLLQDPREKKFYDRYIKTAIAYDFTFDMTEDNMVNTQLDFIRLITSTTTGFTLGASASNDRMRENIRKFLVTDTFEDLITKPVANCDQIPVGPNLVYLIVGEIGLYELISTFIDLNVEGFTLSPKDKAPALGDQLQFNTTFTGSINPKIVLTPMGRTFRLADAALSTSVSRTDKHSVLIGLSLPPKADKTPKKAPTTPYLGIGILTRSVFAARNLSDAQTRAVEAITQFRIDLYYDRATSLAVR